MMYLKYLLSGAIIGVANIIPGVSGGTMAVVLNLYDKLIGAFSNLRHRWKDSLKLLIPVVVGAGLGIVAFSWLIKFLLEKFPLATNYFFIGLIIGSIPMIFHRATYKGFRPLNLIPFALALGLMVGLAFVSQDDSATELIRKLDAASAAKLFFFSIIAAAAMILPGVSGSMILMIFGIYTSVLTAISEMNILVLLPVAVGVIVGIVGGAKLIGLFLKRCPQATFWTILGLILGSLFALFKNTGFSFSVEAIFAILLLLFGAVVAFLFSTDKFREKLTRKKSAKPKRTAR